jgi:hypothetical protein
MDLFYDKNFTYKNTEIKVSINKAFFLIKLKVLVSRYNKNLVGVSCKYPVVYYSFLISYKIGLFNDFFTSGFKKFSHKELIPTAMTWKGFFT